LSTYALIIRRACIAVVTKCVGRGKNASFTRNATTYSARIVVIAVDGCTDARTRLTHVVGSAGISIGAGCSVLSVDASQVGITRIICAGIAVVTVDRLSGAAGAIETFA